MLAQERTSAPAHQHACLPSILPCCESTNCSTSVRARIFVLDWTSASRWSKAWALGAHAKQRKTWLCVRKFHGWLEAKIPHMCICVARLRTRRVMASSHASWTLGHLCPCPIGKGASPPFILTQMHQCHYEPFSPVQEPSCGRPHCSCDGCWPGAQQAAVDPACQFSHWTNPHSGLDLCVAILFVAHAQPASKLESE